MTEPTSTRDSRGTATALATAALVAISTAGAVVGLGMRAGDALRAFRTAGAGLLTSFGLGANAAGHIAAGVVQHTVVSGAWGLLLAIIALRLRLAARIVACVLLVPLYVYITPRVIPPAFRIGFAVTNRDTDLFPIAAALSIALLGGAWVAKRD